MDKTVVGLNVATRSCNVYPEKCWFAVLCRFWPQRSHTLINKAFFIPVWESFLLWRCVMSKIFYPTKSGHFLHIAWDQFHSMRQEWKAVSQGIRQINCCLLQLSNVQSLIMHVNVNPTEWFICHLLLPYHYNWYNIPRTKYLVTIIFGDIFVTGNW
jgi:hypothetical protein